MSHLSLTSVVVELAGEPVLNGVSLDIPEGALVAIVGPSGCGKTTLLRTIAGLVAARSGEIRIGSRMVTTHGIHMLPEKRRVGWVPQDAALFPHLTVSENVAFGAGAGWRAARKAAKGEHVHGLLELVGVAELAGRLPSQLSGGQAQRVAIARALAANPDVVLLDEPFSGLDPALRTELRTEVRALLASQGATGILVTHDQGEALSIADYVAVMATGEIVQYGSPSQIYERPVTPWVARFVGESTLLPGVWASGHVRCDLGTVAAEWVSPTLPAPSDGAAVRVHVRPEQVELTTEGAENSVRATVAAIQYSGHDALLKLRLQKGETCFSRVTASGLVPVDTVLGIVISGPAIAFPA